MSTKKYAIGALLAVALLTAGCGGGNDNGNNGGQASSPAPGNQTEGAAKAITIEASNFEFSPKEIRVKQGETVSITLDNTQGNHAVQIEGYDKEIKGKQTVTFTADKTGEFKFICSIMCGAGHADMVGKLIVE